MSSKIDFSPNENGFVSFRDIVDQHRANEAKAGAEAAKTDTAATKNEVKAEKPPEPKDEVEVVEKGFFESLIDDAGDVAKSGLDTARGALDEAERRVDSALDSGVGMARELDQKVTEAKAEVSGAADEISKVLARESELIEQDFAPVRDKVDEIIAFDVENTTQMRQKLDEADARMSQAIGKSVERHLGATAGDIAEVIADEKSLVEGLGYALFTRNFDSPAEIGALRDNPISRTAIDIGLAVTEEVAPFMKEAANSPGASMMFSNFLPPTLPVIGQKFYEHIALPQINAGLDGAISAAENPEEFKAALLTMTPDNLRAKVNTLEPGQTATMSIGGNFSAHAGVGGEISLGKSLEIKRNEDGSFSVTANHEEGAAAGIGVEAGGAGAKADLGTKQIETVTYRAKNAEAALLLLGVADGSSMERADLLSDDISLEKRVVTVEAGISGDVLAGARGDLVTTSGKVDSDGDGYCDESIREFGNKIGANLVMHVNVGNVFNEDDSHPAIPHLGGDANGWITAKDAERIEQIIAPEFGEAGIAFEASGGVKVSIFSPSSLGDFNETRAEFSATTSLRNGNDVVSIETKCTLQKPVELARAMGCTVDELATMVQSGKLSPQDLSAIADSAGFPDALVIETTVKHSHSKGPSLELPIMKVQDQITTETTLGQLSTRRMAAHEMSGGISV